jgi:hypothetical protein
MAVGVASGKGALPLALVKIIPNEFWQIAPDWFQQVWHNTKGKAVCSSNEVGQGR